MDSRDPSAVQGMVREGLTGIDVSPDWSADPVWAIGSSTLVGELDLDRLGLPSGLVAALRDWRRQWEDALSQHGMSWPSPEAHQAWTARGLTLAHEVQLAVGDRVAVFYSGDGRRPAQPVTGTPRSRS